MGYTKKQKAYAAGECILEGKTIRQTAEELRVKPKTIKEYLQSLAYYDEKLFLKVRRKLLSRK